MHRFSKRERGAVSVFLVIILVPCMLVASIFVDVGRVYLSKAMAESASDMALNSLMTHYDYDLNDWYGMVASCQNIDEFYEASEKCYTSALKSQNLSDDEISTLVGHFRAMIGADANVSDYLKVSETGESATAIKAVDGADLTNSTMLKSQIVDFMKYRAPIAVTETVIDKIQNNSIGGINEVLHSDENKELVEKKQDFCEAEATLMEDSYYTYKYLYDNYSCGNPEPTNTLLTDTDNAMKNYRENYREMNRLLISNLYNTSGLPIFNRCVIGLNEYKKQKSDSGCYSRKEENVYYIDGSTISSQFDNVDTAIEKFEEEKAKFTEAVNNAVTYTAGSTNDIQYWKHAHDALYDTRRDAFTNAAKNMMTEYSKMVAMMECEPGNDLPENYTQTYSDYKNKIEGYQSKYLTAGKSDSRDEYLKIVNRLESISSNNYLNISPDTLTISDGTIFSTKISNIASDLTNKRNTLKKYSDVLNVVIYGDSSKNVKSLESLKTDASNYKTQLDGWSAQADNSSSDNTMAQKDKEEANSIKSSEEAGNITEESITKLETRLKNIKSQLDAAITVIDNFKYGGKKVIEITNYDQFRSAASSVITESQINSRTTNSALGSYADTTFASLFTPQGSSSDAVVSVNTGDDYNLQLNVDRQATAIPGVYQFWRNKYQGADEGKIEEYKNDKSSAKNKQSELEDEAKNKSNPHPDSLEISNEIDNINRTFGNSTLFTSFISLIGNIAGGNFESIRDNLYISTYMLDMFSYSTIDNEGRYNILKSKNFDMATLNKSNFEEKYNSVNDQWASIDYKDHYNKSLTNKMLNKDNNAAYGCELEYILYGGSNDENIKSAYGQIYEIRYILNLISAFQHFWQASPTYTGAAFNSIADTISLATSGVVPVPIVKVVLIALLTVFETANDSNRLEAGFAVEIYKTDASMWQVSLDFNNSTSSGNTSISQMLSTLQTRFEGGFSNSCENGIRYSDYLCIFIVCGMQSGIGESMTLRCADVIQSNMRKITSNDSYKLKNSKTYFELNSQLKVDPLLITLPLYSDYTEAYDSTNTDWCTYDIKTTRGY